jgi:hypothetical protein
MARHPIPHDMQRQPPGVPQETGNERTPFDQSLAWILQAMRVKSGSTALTKMDFRRLGIILDGLQGGWGIATYPIDLIIQPAASAQATFDITRRILNRAAGADISDVQMRITGALIVSSIAAAGSIVVFQVIGPGGGYQLSRVTLPAPPAIIDTKTIFSGVPNDCLKIPVGYALQVTIPATLGGEVVTVNTVTQQTAAGFRV